MNAYLEVELLAEGSVQDYDTTTMALPMAQLLNVSAGMVTVTVTPGSVLIVYQIDAADSAIAGGLKATLSSRLASVESAKQLLGVPALQPPTITQRSTMVTAPPSPPLHPPPSPPPSPPAAPLPPKSMVGAIVGGVVGGVVALLVLCIGYRFIYLRRNKYLPMWHRSKAKSMSRIPGMNLVQTVSVRRQATRKAKPPPDTTSDVYDANGSAADLIAADVTSNVVSVKPLVDAPPAVKVEPPVHPDHPSPVLKPLVSPPATLEDVHVHVPVVEPPPTMMHTSLIATMLDDEQWAVRMAALETVGALDMASLEHFAPAIARRLDDSDPEVREVAVGIFEKLNRKVSSHGDGSDAATDHPLCAPDRSKATPVSKPSPAGFSVKDECDALFAAAAEKRLRKSKQQQQEMATPVVTSTPTSPANVEGQLPGVSPGVGRKGATPEQKAKRLALLQAQMNKAGVPVKSPKSPVTPNSPEPPKSPVTPQSPVPPKSPVPTKSTPQG